MIRMKSIPIYKRFANHSRSSGCRKIPCVSFGQQPSSLEYKLQNAWIERLARGWPKFSTTRKRSCGIYRGCGNERGLWRCPGRHEVLDRHCVVRWKKKKALSIYRYFHVHPTKYTWRASWLWNTYRRPYSPFSPFSPTSFTRLTSASKPNVS